MLDNVGFYLHGRLIHILPNEEQVRREHDQELFQYFAERLRDGDASPEEIEAAFKAEEDILDFEKKTVTFGIKGWDMSWTMDTDSIKSMFLSSVQESLVKLKTQIGTAKGEEGGTEDGNGKEAR